LELHILDEGKRCLRCGKCSEGCPVNTPIAEMINLLMEGEIKRAGEMLFMNNPMSVVCSLVCPHEKQCEGHCVLGKKGSPIQISNLEHYISDYYLNVMDLRPEEKKDQRVGIIGSGPAGITISFLLALKGYKVTLFESQDRIGGVMRYGIPAFRLPKDILDRMEKRLTEIGVKIRPNTRVGKIITLDDLFRDGYEAIFMGTGVWNPNTLGIKGESLGHVHYAIDYLRNPDVYHLGERVCVIGAGNTAMDVARTVVRHGSGKVYVMYRKDEDHIPARKIEQEYSRIDGVQFLLNTRPLEVTEEGVKYINTENIGTEEDAVWQDVEGSEGFFPVDSVIVAASQGPRAHIVSNNRGLKINPRSGLVLTDECGRTTREGVFASGDVVTGAKTVVEAVRVSKLVAEAMDNYLQGKREDLCGKN
jgi:glutamate synthase (NADPH/NADH) small chain